MKYRFSLLLLVLVAGLLLPLPTLANGDHVEATTHRLPAYVLQIGGFSLIALALAIPILALYLRRLARQGPRPRSGLADYFYQLSRFSRNAKLFLALSLSSWLGQGVWAVLFNLYLLSAGFDVKFVGFWLTINMFFHGFMAFPAGVIADWIGRRNTFLLSNVLQLVFRLAALFTLDPALLLILAAAIGFGEGFHAVAGAPFMMENSEPEERPHLFSLDASLIMVSRMGGSFLGGILPVAFASLAGLSVESAQAQRLGLFASLPITLVGLLPIYYIRERRPPPDQRERLSNLVRLNHLEHRKLVGQLTLTTIFYGFGFGFTIPFFNVFFNQAFGSTADQVGFILGVSALAGAFTVLFNPFIVKRWGKVKGLFWTQLMSFPFLLFMGAMPNLQLSVLLFFLWRGWWSFSFPLRNQFTMEQVSPRERATVNGIVHGTMDVLGSPAAAAAGLALATGNYILPFSVAAVSFVVPAFLWLAFFGRLEVRAASTQAPA